MVEKTFGMKLENIPIGKLVPNPKNPRIDLKPGMPLYEKLKNSMGRWDYIDPIIWNKRTGMIVSGHQRFQVMKDIAADEGKTIKTVPVIVVDMAEEDQDAFMVAANKITGLWDQEKLAALFKDMDSDMVKFTGFDDFEIESMLSDVPSGEPFPSEESEDATPAVSHILIEYGGTEEAAWLAKLLNEDGNLKKKYAVSQLMHRIDTTNKV